MAVFLKACLNSAGPLRAAIDATIRSQREDEDSGGKIGLGWMLAGPTERPVVWHNGATAGSYSFIGFSPKAGAGVVILANVQKASEKLGFDLLGIEAPKPPVLTVANAADYPGLYPLVPGFSIAVTEAGGTLFGQGTGQPRFALRPLGPDRFSLMGLDAELSFARGADGKVTAMTLHQNGRDVRGKRNELPKGVTLPPETLAEYAGHYPLAVTFVLTVTVENGAVFVQATGQQKLPVQASAKDEFFYTGVDAKISFQRDDSGKVMGLVLRQNGRDMPGKKVP
jgi:D-alanyl-D-alanine-carboxypeptidase/D-alanyl-D-alanine-endopeptidase